MGCAGQRDSGRCSLLLLAEWWLLECWCWILVAHCWMLLAAGGKNREKLARRHGEVTDGE